MPGTGTGGVIRPGLVGRVIVGTICFNFAVAS